MDCLIMIKLFGIKYSLIDTGREIPQKLCENFPVQGNSNRFA